MSAEQEAFDIDIRPSGDRVLVLRDETHTTTESGIVIPESGQVQPCRGEIVAIGRGRLMENGERSDFEHSVGDRVMYVHYAGTELEYGGRTYLVMAEQDILAWFPSSRDCS